MLTQPAPTAAASTQGFLAQATAELRQHRASLSDNVSHIEKALDRLFGPRPPEAEAAMKVSPSGPGDTNTLQDAIDSFAPVLHRLAAVAEAVERL